MPTLQLRSHPAVQRPSGTIAVAYRLDGRLEPLGRRLVAIRTAAEAQAAFDAYAEDLRATGVSARVDADLLPGERAPRGFRGLDLTAYVNLEITADDGADLFTGEPVNRCDPAERF